MDGRNVGWGVWDGLEERIHTYIHTYKLLRTTGVILTSLFVLIIFTLHKKGLEGRKEQATTATKKWFPRKMWLLRHVFVVMSIATK